MSSRRWRSARHRHAHDREPVVEVLAEVLRGHLVAQVAVGGGDHAHRDVLVAGAADRPDGVLVERAQQRPAAPRATARRSRRGTCVPPSASAKAPRRSEIGAGERAAHVAEQRRFDQLARARRRSRTPRTDRPRRALWRWISSASSSLPVPVSPSSSTVASVLAHVAQQAEQLAQLRDRGRPASRTPPRRPGSDPAPLRRGRTSGSCGRS